MLANGAPVFSVIADAFGPSGVHETHSVAAGPVPLRQVMRRNLS